MPTKYPRTDWVAVLPPRAFADAQRDPRFHLIITLGRVANALSLARLPLLRPVTWQSPRIRRERQSAFLYAGAVLFEGLRLAEALAGQYRNHPKWPSTFGQILADPDIQQLRSRYLKPLRDQSVFHFDVDVAREALATAELQELILVSGRGIATQDIYFDLADDTVLVGLFGSLDPNAYMHDLEKFMVDTSDLYLRFLRAAHQFTAAALNEFGVRRRGPLPSDPAERARRKVP